MSEKSKKPGKEFQENAKARIDAKAESIEPIDYSFKDLMSLEEINDSPPRNAEKKEPRKQDDGKYLSLGLKLGYNALKDINGLYDWCVFSFAFPNKISSLDISFNCLSNIPDEVVRFEGLKCLYLHGNKIIDLKEVDKLRSLKFLTALTLHGNPIENLPIFKHYILSRVPNLKHLNFTGVSKVDKQTALIRLRSNTTPLAVVTHNPEDQSKKVVVKDDD